MLLEGKINGIARKFKLQLGHLKKSFMLLTKEHCHLNKIFDNRILNLETNA